MEWTADRERFAQAAAEHGRAMFRAARAVLDSDADAEDAVGEARVSEIMQEEEKPMGKKLLRTAILAAALGSFAPYSRTVEGVSAVDQGIEIRVVSALMDESDGTAPQTAGGRPCSSRTRLPPTLEALTSPCPPWALTRRGFSIFSLL